MYEKIQMAAGVVGGIPIFLVIIIGLILSFIGLFKRKEYYQSHRQTFTMWQAIGFVLYMQLMILLLVWIEYAISLIIALMAIPFGRPMEFAYIIESIAMVLLTPVLIYAWIIGYKKISKKIEDLAKADKELKEARSIGIEDVYMNDIVDGKKLQLRMFIAGAGSMFMCYLKVLFWWTILIAIVLRIMGVFNSRD